MKRSEKNAHGNEWPGIQRIKSGHPVAIVVSTELAVMMDITCEASNCDGGEDECQSAEDETDDRPIGTGEGWA